MAMQVRRRQKKWTLALILDFSLIDPGMTLTLKINGGPEVTLVPGGGMLAAIDDMSTLCNGTSTYTSFYCRDTSNVAPGSSNFAYNYAYITATQYVVGAKVSFVKAVIPYATHRSGYVFSIIRGRNQCLWSS